MKQFVILLDGMTGAGKSTTSNFLEKKIPRMVRVGFDRVKDFVSDFERGERDNGIAREITYIMTKKYLDLDLSVLIEHSFKNEEEIKSYEILAQNRNIPCLSFNSIVIQMNLLDG